MTDTATHVRRVQAKICGLTRAEDARHAEVVGADYLGVILAGGPRHLDTERAGQVLGPRRDGIARVAVFGTQTVAEIVAIAETLDLDVLQLHGTDDPEVTRAIRAQSGRATWPVLRVAGTTLPPVADDLARVSDALVLDAHVVGQLGGTGVALDWRGLATSIAALRARHPSLRLVLAGGLRPTNVTDAISLLAPDVVDVSSGVESSPGVKDPVTVETFVRTVGAKGAGTRDAG